jgi:hypothetical protein
VDRVLVLIEIGNEIANAALVAELDLVAGAALVYELDPQALRQEGGLAHPLSERLEVVVELVEDLEVGEEGDRRPGLLRRLAFRELAFGNAALVALAPDVPVAANLEVEALGEGVDDRHADAVKTARDLVAAPVAELPAGVEDGQNDLGGGPLLLLVEVDRDPAAVV